MKYNDLRSQLSTGDIVLFSGKGLVSTVIKKLCRSKWSHIGMVLRIPEYDFVALWESTTLSKVKDIETGEGQEGVQLVPLSQRIKTYDGNVAIRQLNNASINDEDIHSLMTFRHEVAKRPYEQDKLELIKSAYDGIGGSNEEDLSSLFCSELVTEALQRMGLLVSYVPSNELTPADYGNNGTIQDYMTRGSLLPEMNIEV